MFVDFREGIFILLVSSLRESEVKIINFSPTGEVVF